MPEENRKMITLRLEQELHEAASRKVFDLKTSFQAVLTEKLRDWTFSEGKAPAAPVVAGYPYPRTREDHETLEFILGADRQAAEQVRGTLKLFAEAVRARSAVRPKRKTG